MKKLILILALAFGAFTNSESQTYRDINSTRTSAIINAYFMPNVFNKFVANTDTIYFWGLTPKKITYANSFGSSNSQSIKIVTGGTQRVIIDSAAARIGVGTTVRPDATIRAKGAATTSTTFAMKITNSVDSVLFRVQNNGTINMNNLRRDSTGLAKGDIFILNGVIRAKY